MGRGAGFDGGLYQNPIKKETILSGHLTGGGGTLNPPGAPGGAPGRGGGWILGRKARAFNELGRKTRTPNGFDRHPGGGRPCGPRTGGGERCAGGGEKTGMIGGQEGARRGLSGSGGGARPSEPVRRRSPGGGNAGNEGYGGSPAGLGRLGGVVQPLADFSNGEALSRQFGRPAGARWPAASRSTTTAP